MSRCLKSGLAPAIRSMIDYKVSLGYEESTYLPRSRSLDRYCMEHFPDETSLTREVVTGWLERHPGESIGYFHSRAGYARGLGKYLASMGIPSFILPEKFTSGRSCFLPYIFTDSELKELFHVIDAQGSRENSLQPFLLSTVFRLIYTCGLRPNEGRMLKRESVNLKTGEILITETKGHKERIVVMSDDMTGLAASYARLRDAAYPDSPYFFPDRNGNSYSSPWMQNKFKAFFAAANPGVDPDMLPPVRIYDLRHRFASAALSRWLDSGENLFNRLPYLRAYMGHKELSATVYYIHLLPENLVKSAGIDWDSLRRMIPEVELWDE